MKLMAMRFGEDDEDIEVLLGECGVQSAEESARAATRCKSPRQRRGVFFEEMLGTKSPP
jgi:hypothetical protein